MPTILVWYYTCQSGSQESECNIPQPMMHDAPLASARVPTCSSAAPHAFVRMENILTTYPAVAGSHNNNNALTVSIFVFSDYGLGANWTFNVRMFKTAAYRGVGSHLRPLFT